jgi:hypothetical protein
MYRLLKARLFMNYQDQYVSVKTDISCRTKYDNSISFRQILIDRSTEWRILMKCLETNSKNSIHINSYPDTIHRR